MSMLHTGSPFFDRFSLRQLIERNYPWATTRQTGPGGGSGFIGSGKSSHDKSETFSCTVHTAGEDRFDEPRFIESLRSLIEKQIIDSGATISSKGANGPAEFFCEYTYEDIRGRVDLGGKLIIANYVLTAEIKETGEGAAHKPDWPGLIQPRGEYYVIGITEKNSLRARDGFIQTGSRLVTESVERIRNSGRRFQDAEYAEVFSLFRIPPEIRRAVEERQINLNLELNPDPWEQYAKYEAVYFLNEVAVRMYRDAGVELEILGKVSAADMPRQCHRSLRGPYFSDV